MNHAMYSQVVGALEGTSAELADVISLVCTHKKDKTEALSLFTD